ncbi:MAG: glycosyltransferase family 4 protein [candidate division WOR-3 bacterium]
MPKVLIISYYTPPIGMSGVMRITKLAKYLKKFGWQPSILTTKQIAYYHYDYELLNDLREIPIYRSENLDFARLLYLIKIPQKLINHGTGKISLFSNFFFFPDAKVFWIRFAYKLGCKIVSNFKPDVILASAPPFSSLIVARWLKEKFQIPFIADFRDPWPTGTFPPPKSYQKKLRELRNMITNNADAVTVVNRMTALQIDFPNAYIIENGYDPDDFKLPAYDFSKFSIVYTGNISNYINELCLTAEAVASLPDIKIFLAGKSSAKDLAKLAQYGNVEYLGMLPHSKTVSLMKGASLLLYISKPNQIVGIKLYEYFGAQKPILGVCNKCNEAMRLIEYHNVGISVGCRKDEIRNAILQLKDNLTSFQPKDIDRYNRINQAALLCSLMNRIIGK